MSSGYYAACTGLVSRTAALDTIANNLANVSTAGFRASHNSFSSVLATSDNAGLSTLNQDINDFGVLNGTQIDGTQGALVPTNNELDVAIEGPGYFAVQGPSGEVYTRGGSFRVSAQGKLITPAGDQVLGDSGPITIAGLPINISADGTITAKGAISGRLKLVEFAPTTNIRSAGGSYYTAPQGSEVAAAKSKVRQGMLESSNVNPVSGVVELISAQREVESMRHMLSMFSSEMDKTASQDLPRVS